MEIEIAGRQLRLVIRPRPKNKIKEASRILSVNVMSKQKVLVFICLMLMLIPISGYSDDTIPDDAISLKGPAPAGLLVLSGEVPSHENTPVDEGPHGLIQYCYQAKNYIVLKSNVVGEGYEISDYKPANLKCLKINNTVFEAKNDLGMYIGMPRQDAIDKLRIKTKKNDVKIVWESTTKINEVIYDVQTYVEIEFVEDKLKRLSVFTTTTS